MNDIEFQINEMKLKIICMQSELEDCIAEEKEFFNKTNYCDTRIEYIKKICFDLIFLQRELRECRFQEIEKQNELDNIQARVEYAERVCVDLCFGKQSDIIKKTLSNEQINNLSLILEEEETTDR